MHLNKILDVAKVKDSAKMIFALSFFISKNPIVNSNSKLLVLIEYLAYNVFEVMVLWRQKILFTSSGQKTGYRKMNLPKKFMLPDKQYLGGKMVKQRLILKH